MNKQKKKKKDQQIREHKERYKKIAIDEIGKQIEENLKDYVEPLRAGTPKGDPIGLSLKKYKAAQLMVLFPQVLKLKDISKMTETPEGVIRVWRTEKTFREVTKVFGSIIAKSITKSIDSELDSLESEPDYSLGLIETWIAILPLFDSSVAEPFAKYLKGKIDSATNEYQKIVYPSIALRLIQEASVYDIDSLKKWETRPEIFDLTKTIIEGGINDLMGLAARGEDSWEDTQKFADSLKKFIINKLDLLAK